MKTSIFFQHLGCEWIFVHVQNLRVTHAAVHHGKSKALGSSFFFFFLFGLTLLCSCPCPQVVKCRISSINMINFFECYILQMTLFDKYLQVKLCGQAITDQPKDLRILTSII